MFFDNYEGFLSLLKMGFNVGSSFFLYILERKWITKADKLWELRPESLKTNSSPNLEN